MIMPEAPWKVAKQKKLCLIINVDWFFLSHRLSIALEALRRGYEVSVLAVEEEGLGDEIRSFGMAFVPLPTTRGGQNPWAELRVLRVLYRHYRRERPDIVHHVSLKPVLWGSIAARLAGVPNIVNAITGFGSLFIGRGVKPWVVQFVVKRLLSHVFQNRRVTVICQNADDHREVMAWGWGRRAQVRLIRGSGVDLEAFAFAEPPQDGPLRVLLPARVLWDKGVQEFYDAAHILHSYYPDVEFVIAGKVDTQNISAVPEEVLEGWNQEGVVRWLGFQLDMPECFRQCHIVALPSYREGLPKVLLEACAVGRPIVATDVPGCREVVEHGVNGYLVPARKAAELASALARLLGDADLRRQMGQTGRQMAESAFGIAAVLEATFAIYEQGF